MGEHYLMSLYFKAGAILLEQKKKTQHYLANPEHAKFRKQNFMMYGHLAKQDDLLSCRKYVSVRSIILQINANRWLLDGSHLEQKQYCMESFMRFILCAMTKRSLGTVWFVQKCPYFLKFEHSYIYKTSLCKSVIIKHFLANAVYFITCWFLLNSLYCTHFRFFQSQ